MSYFNMQYLKRKHFSHRIQFHTISDLSWWKNEWKWIKIDKFYLTENLPKKSYKNAKIWKFDFSYFLVYLLNYLTYRNVLYLILILERFWFDLLKSILSISVTVFKLYGRKAVYFFFVCPLDRKWSYLVGIKIHFIC